MLILPHRFGTLLEREEPTVEHDVDQSTSFALVSIMLSTRFYNTFVWATHPQSGLLVVHEANLVGGPDLNAGAAPHAASFGSVM